MFEFKKRETEKRLLITIGKWVTDIIFVVLLAYFIISYTFVRYSVVGHSMESATKEGGLLNGDIVMVNKVEYSLSKPDRYDIIVIEAQDDSNLEYHVKRIIGLPGETVQIKNGYIYINDVELKDDITDVEIYNTGLAENKITLGKDEYFVLGDNRNNSNDSRSESFGNVKFDEIIGSVWFRISPLEKFGFVK